MAKRRRFRLPKIEIKNLLDRKFIPIYITVAALIVVLVLVTSAGGNDAVTREEDTAFANRNTIYVGVVVDGDDFASLDDQGNYSGFNIDFIKELLKRAYPNKTVSFKVIDSQIASYELKTGEINLAIGKFTKGVTKTQGLSLTKGYYTDDVNAYVKADSGITELNELRSKSVLVMTTEVSRSSVKTELDKINEKMKIVPCSSYKDALESINKGTNAALIAPSQLARPRVEELQALLEPVTTVDYCVLAWTDNSSVTSYLDIYIEQMKKDGTIENFAKQYSLPYNQAEEEK